MNRASVRRITAGRLYTPHESDLLAMYGQCPRCAGPMHAVTTVAGIPNDLTVRIDRQCLWCGEE